MKLQLTKADNGGWLVEEPVDYSTGLKPRVIAAFSDDFDMLEGLADIIDPEPECDWDEYPAESDEVCECEACRSPDPQQFFQDLLAEVINNCTSRKGGNDYPVPF